MKGIIYKATSPSGKVYIGQTIKTLKKRKIEHFSRAFNKNNLYNTKFYYAIRKYGKYAFSWKILYRVSVIKLNTLEISYFLVDRLASTLL